ncbi:hypothetical protein G0U57_006011, partial [Chelydra serpentina]
VPCSGWMDREEESVPRPSGLRLSRSGFGRAGCRGEWGGEKSPLGSWLSPPWTTLGVVVPYTEAQALFLLRWSQKQMLRKKNNTGKTQRDDPLKAHERITLKALPLLLRSYVLPNPPPAFLSFHLPNGGPAQVYPLPRLQGYGKDRRNSPLIISHRNATAYWSACTITSRSKPRSLWHN